MKTYFLTLSEWSLNILTVEEFIKKLVLPTCIPSHPRIVEIKDRDIDSLTIDELMKKYVLPIRIFPLGETENWAIYRLTVSDAGKITICDNLNDIAEDIIHAIKAHLIGDGGHAKLEGEK